MAALATLLAVLLAGTEFPELRNAYRAAVGKAGFEEAGRLADEMARTGGDEVRTFLESEFKTAARPPVRRLLFRALAALERPDRTEFLLGNVGAEEPFFRATALEALNGIDRELARAKAVILIGVDDDPRVRTVAAEVLGEARGPGVCLALLHAAASLPSAEQPRLLDLLRAAAAEDLAEVAEEARSPEPRMRALALVALAGSAAERFRDAFEEARRDPDPVVALAAAAALDRIKTPGRSPSVRDVLARVRKFDDCYRLYELLATLPLRDPELVTALRRAATSGPAPLRPRAAETLGHLAGVEAMATLAPMLGRGTAWQLSVGAARGLALTRDPGAVDVLIASLEGARGRLGHEIASALESLTGQAFGLNPERWSDWWQVHRTGFQVAGRAAPRWEEPHAFRDRYAFYGVDIRSEAVAFVLDLSGSMDGEPLATLKKELSSAIRAMPESARFNLIPFHDRAYPWSRRLVPARGKGRKAGLEFIENLRVGGSTNLWDALQAAISDPQVDTVVILTDGAPSAGEVTDMGEIRRRFLEQNRERMILLHAIAIGTSSPELRTMALQSDGTYKQTP